ncbi:carboxylesterase/lipase family protein [Amycolatopsis suaedae]|uniref:Carboxylesterase n=1 Tax=Amycolatopsis suaedae TaxID=2510978 RepID=A0A4Q7IZT8_9PSEU|nr:carboxylesterase family protein [Amycolatopsis suaedae]RZQ60017.1 carboxylesterase [Amycolatopsis suaedae]
MRLFTSMLVASLALAACSAESTSDPTLVRVSAGEVRGTESGNVRTFQGIPYGAAGRWEPTGPAAPWQGVRDATKPGNMCPQGGTQYAQTTSTTEDCLVLNVTAPRTATKDSPKPVMVWLHGDGGVGAGHLFDARALAETGDVVVVTVNYRLGIFGNFSMPGMDVPGSFGLLDQQEAMRWVRREIAAFGGKPDNVTLFGESYGAQSASAHLVSPQARGLFDRVILQSGFALMDMPAGSLLPDLEAQPWWGWRTAEEQSQLAAASIGQVGCADLNCLRGLPADRLFGLMQPFQSFAYGNQVLPKAPAEAFAAGEFHPVPVLMGATRDEHRGFTGLFFDLLGTPVTAEQYPRLLDRAFGDRAAEVAREYPLTAFESPSIAWATVLTDRMWARSTDRFARAVAKRAAVHFYEFADRAAPSFLPFPPTFPPGAFHAGDLPYVFPDEEFTAKSTPEQKELSGRMIRYWAGFAHRGDPNGAGLPRWPAFGEGGHVQSLGTGPAGVGPADYRATHKLDFWDRMPG